jgi:hypothetical protein
MPDRRKFAQMAIAGLLTVVIFAPTASAQPMTEGTYTSKAYAPTSAATEVHASTVHKAAAAQQDLRGEGSIASSRAAAHATTADLRSENTADPSRAPEPPIGMPVFPTDTKPIAQPAPQPVADDGGGIDVDWPIAMIALAGALAVGGGIAFAARRTRPHVPAH